MNSLYDASDLYDVRPESTFRYPTVLGLQPAVVKLGSLLLDMRFVQCLGVRVILIHHNES